MTRLSSLSSTAYDAEAAAAAADAILDSAQSVITPPSTKSPSIAPVYFTSTLHATPVPLNPKLPFIPSRHTPLSTSRPYHPNLPSAARPPLPADLPTPSPPSAQRRTSCSRPPIVDLPPRTPQPAAILPSPPPPRTPFTPAAALETPSAIFGKLEALSGARTPFATNTPRSALVSAIPLTFSAVNTPLPRNPCNPSAPVALPLNISPSTPETPGPRPAASVVASFFRQRSANLSSPIFRSNPRSRTRPDLSDPVVIVSPLEENRSELPSDVGPVLELDIPFSLKKGFAAPVSLNLGLRAARVPLLYAIHLQLTDEDGPIRPMSVRLERCLETPPSMFLSVLNSEINVPDVPDDDDDDNVNDESLAAAREALSEQGMSFWAAPENNVSDGSGRLLLTVTDQDYGDHEVSIDISASPTMPKISVQGPGEFAHHVIRAETSVFFGQRDDYSDKTIWVWNETGGGAPVFVNLVMEDSAGGSFSIATENGEESDCIPAIIQPGEKACFVARFAFMPEVTVRKMYYGSVLIKYATVLPSAESPGTDRELDQFYDHVLNFKAAIGQDFDTDDDTSKTWKVSEHSDTRHRPLPRDCLCSDDEEYAQEDRENQHDDVLQHQEDDGEHEERDEEEVIQNLSEALNNFDVRLEPDGEVVDQLEKGRVLECEFNLDAVPNWREMRSPDPEENNALDILSSEAAKQPNIEDPQSRIAQSTITTDVLTKSKGLPVMDVSSKGGRPKLKLPRRIRENGLALKASAGTVELPMFNASNGMVEVSIRIRKRNSVSVSPNYVVVNAREKSVISLIRESSAADSVFVELLCSTMEEPRRTTTYEVPMTIEAAAVHIASPDGFMVDRPTLSFYNPSSEAVREGFVRIRNGTARDVEFRVWIGNEGGEPEPVLNDFGTPVFRLISDEDGVIPPGEFVCVRVYFDGGDMSAHYMDRLNMEVDGYLDFMSLFGYSGSHDIQLRSSEDGYVVATNHGDRFGFVVITGPEHEVQTERAVLKPGEERRLNAPHGSGSLIYTGDEIARARMCYSERLRGESCEGTIFTGEFPGEHSAVFLEGLDWQDDDKYSMFYAGRLLDHNVRKFVFDVDMKSETGFVEEEHMSGCRWAAIVEGGYIHIENLDIEHELEFEVSGAEPRCGVVPALGDAKVAAFRENVEIRAMGTVQQLTVDLSEYSYALAPRE